MVNPLGAVVIFDGEVPRTFTARAITTISGGQLVVTSGATANTVGSSASSFVDGVIQVDLQGVATDFCNGIALNTATSGQLITIATRGAFLVRAASIISGGQNVTPFSGTSQGVVGAVTGSATAGGYLGTTIGRALTPSASGTNLYTLVSLNI